VARFLEVVDHFRDQLRQLRVELHGIIAMDAANEVRALAEIDTVYFALLVPLVVCVSRFH
jgi:hypothetical protein